MISRLFAVLLMLTPVLATASTIDDIARLEQAKEGADRPHRRIASQRKAPPQIRPLHDRRRRWQSRSGIT